MDKALTLAKYTNNYTFRYLNNVWCMLYLLGYILYNFSLFYNLTGILLSYEKYIWNLYEGRKKIVEVK